MKRTPGFITFTKFMRYKPQSMNTTNVIKSSLHNIVNHIYLFKKISLLATLRLISRED